MKQALRLVGILVTGASACHAAAQGPPATFVYTVPGIAKVAGKNGTHFVSDAVIANPGSAPALVTYGFVPTVGSTPFPAFLSPGQSVTVRDVVATLFGASTGSGALTVTGTQPLVIRARTYNDASTGTYGVALPVYTDDRFLQPGDTAHSLWVSQSPDPNAGFRSNATVLFPDGGGGSATVTVFDGNGSQIGQQVFSMTSAGVQQLGIGTFSSPANVARATIQVVSGRAAGYVSVVDNTTGDSSLYTFDDLPAGAQDVLINGVAWANGKLGTFFRTDGRFFNPGASDVLVTARFHAKGTSNPSPVSQTLVVPAGKVVEITDLVGTLLGQPVGSSGALRFTAASPVGILCRTSNVDPTGVHPGTYGAQQRPVPIPFFLSSADAGALITGVRQNASFRTNIALAAGPDGATAQFTLKAGDGSVASSATQTLGPWGWVQTAVDVLFGGAPPADAEVAVTITQGSGDLFDSSLDNLSGDSVVTPAPPLPVAIPSSATIGPAGGSIRSDDGRLTLKVPAGALAGPTALSIVTGANGAPSGLGSGYSITPAALSFAKAAQLVFRYGASDVDGTSPDLLGLAHLSGSAWRVVRGGAVDTGMRALAVPLLTTGVAASAPSRVPLIPAPVSWAPFGSLDVMIVGGQRGLFPGDTRGIFVSTVGPPSTAPDDGSDDALLTAPSPVAPASWQYHWYVNGASGGNASVGTVSPNGSAQVTYGAPSCIPWVDPVGVAVHILDNLGHDILMVRRLMVFSRTWTVEIEEDVNINCRSFGQATFSYEFGSTDRLGFSLADDGSITNIHSMTPQNPTFLVQPTTCSGPCSLTFNPGFTPLRINTGSVTGNLDLTNGILNLLYTAWTYCDTPNGTLTCEGVSAPFSGEKGGPDHFGPVPVGPDGGTNPHGSDTKISVKPADPRCSP